MKFYKNGKYVKLIPKKFQEIPNLGDLLEDFDCKRLTSSERKALERALLRKHLDDFINGLLEDPRIEPYIKRSKPLAVLNIKTRISNYTSVRFDNDMEVECPNELYLTSPIKKEVVRIY